MTAIFLVFFSVLFYQLLIKPALNPTTSPNASRNFSQTQADEREHLMQIWRKLGQFKGEQGEEEHGMKRNTAQKETASNKQSEGFKGGEYIEYEDL